MKCILPNRKLEIIEEKTGDHTFDTIYSDIHGMEY